MTPPDPPPAPPADETPDPRAAPAPAPQADDEGPDEDTVALGAGIDFTDPNSPLAPYYLRASHVVAVGLLGLLYFYFSNLMPLNHTDVWGHLRFGQWIVEHGELPEHEPFSPFSDHESPYVHFQWLSQASAYLVFEAGGWLAGGSPLRQEEGGIHLLRSAVALVVVLRFLILMLAFRRLTGSLPLACAGVVVVFAAQHEPAAMQRPQVVGELLFACLMLALARPVLSRRALVLVPLAVALWANCHGSFLVGLMLLGVTLAGRGLETLREAQTYNPLRAFGDSQVRRLLLVLALSAAAAGLLNPHGPAIYGHALRLAGHPNVGTMEEWQPLDFHNDSGGHWIYLALLALLLVSQTLSPRPLTTSGLVLLLSFGVLPLVQQRMMTWWAMLVPALALPLWQAAGERLPWPWLHRPSVLSFRKTLLAAGLVVLALLYSGPGSWLLAGQPRQLPGALSPATPWRVALQLDRPAQAPNPPLPELAKALKDYPGGRFTGRIFANEVLGDYLLWKAPADHPVLVYSHVHVFPEKHWQDYTRVLLGQPGWWEPLERYRVNLVVINSEIRKELAGELRKSPDWSVVLDEAGSAQKPDPRTRLLVALRKRPLT